MKRPLQILTFSLLPLFVVSWGFVFHSQAGPVVTTLERNAAWLMPTNAEGAYGVGNWVWADAMLDKQFCRFWKAITIPRDSVVVEARVRTTADNSYRFYLDGQEVTQGSAWESLTECDVTSFMKPGVHVLAMEAFNDYAAAGAIVALRVELADGRVIKAGTDRTWYLVPLTEPAWQKRTKAAPEWSHPRVLGPFGTAPWNRPGRLLKLAPLQPITLKFWQTGWFQITLLSVCGVVGLICVHLLSRLAVQSKAQQLLHLERARIARDFHDDLGARITQAVLLSEVARRAMPGSPDVQPKLEQLCTRMRDLSGAIKEVVWVVNSQRDTLRDFVSYVASYAEGFFATTPIRCRFDLSEELPNVTFELAARRNLLLAVKEALNNAAKYSEATEILLRIHCDAQAVHVVVEDNGKGFAPDGKNTGSNGLINMAQRMTSLGGECRVTSQPGAGCRVEFTMPLSQTRAKRNWLRRRKPALPTVIAAAAPESPEALASRTETA